MITISKRFLLSMGICAAILLSACEPTHTFNHMAYLADTITDSQKATKNYAPLVLEIGDRIYIKVTALNPESALVYNNGVPNSSAVVAGIGSTNAPNANGGTGQGYLIDEKGNIKFPQIGAIKAVGLTASALADTIQNKLLAFIKEPLVTVELGNFQVNILGEVNKPGALLVADGKITIIEAISQAGDLTVNGLRDNILVVREKNGKREYGRVNLASNNIFESPFFFLKQGDIVYVEMNKNKLLASDQLHLRRINYTALALTAITATALIYNSLKK